MTGAPLPLGPRSRTRRWPVLPLIVLAASAALPLVAARAATAATPVPDVVVVVNRTDGHASGSLRRAIDNLNASGGRAGIIVVFPGIYRLTSCGTPDDTNASGDLDLTDPAPVAIVGLGRVTVQQTCAGERVLDDHAGSRLVLADVTITGGNAASADPATLVTGGGIRATGGVTLLNCTIIGNRATAAPGADATDTAPAGVGGSARGGGIDTQGPVGVLFSTVSGNSAIAGHGGSEPLGFANGAGGAATGGGIATPSPVQLSREHVVLEPGARRRGVRSPTQQRDHRPGRAGRSSARRRGRGAGRHRSLLDSRLRQRARRRFRLHHL